MRIVSKCCGAGRTPIFSHWNPGGQPIKIICNECGLECDGKLILSQILDDFCDECEKRNNAFSIDYNSKTCINKG